VLHNPAITSPIAGATKPHHLEDAVAALSVRLSDKEIGRLEELYQTHPVTEAFI
jgi:aryl-alcohol dehydrogenase-like predicted oxidoreductase